MVWSFPVHTHAHTHLLCLRATCPNLDGFLPFFVLYDKQLDQCWTVTNKKTRHLKTSAQTLGIHDGYFSLLSRLSSDQLILPIIVAANQLFLYNWKNQFPMPDSQFATTTTRSLRSGSSFIVSFHCAKVSFRIGSLHYVPLCLLSISGRPHKEEGTSARKMEWKFGCLCFAGTEINFKLGLTRKEKKKKKDKKYANVRKREDDSSLLADRETVK